MCFFKQLLPVVFLLFLNGCVDVNMGFNLKDEQLDLRIQQSADSAKLGLNPNKKCEEKGGSLIKTSDGGSICEQSTQFSMAAWLSEGKVSFIDGSASTTQIRYMPISVKEVEEGTIKLVLDVNAFISELNKDSLPSDMPPPMKEAMLESLKRDAGNQGFHIAFTGEQIKETNGKVSNNGTTVTFYISMSDVIDPAHKQSPDNYTATIQTRSDKLLVPVTINGPEVENFISNELQNQLPRGWQAVVVMAEVSDGKVSMMSDCILNGTAHRITLPDERASKAALLQLHHQMLKDGMQWKKAKLTIKPEGSLRIEPLEWL